MKLGAFLAVFGLLALPFSAVADEYTNGWTESTFRSAVKGCVDSVAAKQMQFMYSSGQIKKDAPPADIESARSRVMAYALGACTCAQKRIMRDVAFDDVKSLQQRPEYAREVMTTCAKEAAKAPG